MSNPLAEVFGFPITNTTRKARRYRQNRLCPFHNVVPSCTKDKANDPLGVCSIFYEQRPVITCPIRFRQDWLIAEDAAGFFFPPQTQWTSLSEVRLTDKDGNPAGNIDLTLVAYDQQGKVLDFGALEIQAVYISGNIRRPFEGFMSQRQPSDFEWLTGAHYPKPDFLSSSRKRLAPQLLYKGGILKSWGKKQAVAIQKCFFETLPILPTVAENKADIAWFVYDLFFSKKEGVYELRLVDKVFSEFEPSMRQIVTSKPGLLTDFIAKLQHRLDEKLEGHPPENHLLTDPPTV